MAKNAKHTIKKCYISYIFNNASTTSLAGRPQVPTVASPPPSPPEAWANTPNKHLNISVKNAGNQIDPTCKM